jgi:hypothetical protein
MPQPFMYHRATPYINHKVSKQNETIHILHVATYMRHASGVYHDICQHECLHMIAGIIYSVSNSERAFTCPFLSWYQQHSMISSNKDASIQHSFDGSYSKQRTSMHLPSLVMAPGTLCVLYVHPVADCHVLQRVVLPWITAFCPPD